MSGEYDFSLKYLEVKEEPSRCSSKHRRPARELRDVIVHSILPGSSLTGRLAVVGH